MSSIIRGSDNFDSDIIPAGRVASAWVNFNGTGTVAIRDSYNVASITDNGTGDYTVNFAVALANANYSSTCASGGNIGFGRPNTKTVSSMGIITYLYTAAATDFDDVNVQIFGGQ